MATVWMLNGSTVSAAVALATVRELRTRPDYLRERTSYGWLHSAGETVVEQSNRALPL